MRCEVVAVGTELLLGPNVDTNSTWIGERLAEQGIDSYFHTVVGDNGPRIVEALRIALGRSDAVIVTGGLGPTQDDITREAIADVMGVPLVLDPVQQTRIEAIFAERRRPMTANNLRQAWRPEGTEVIEQRRGSAPGLRCPIGEGRVIYALPGVPHEMQEMLERAVLPELRARAGTSSVIKSRVLRTWGVAESALDELVAPRLAALDRSGNPTIAFLARGIEGTHVRVTAKASTPEEADALLDAEEAELRAILGPLVFGIDDQTMEMALADLLGHHDLSLAVAESVTGGMIAARLTAVPGGSAWLRGGIVSYSTDVKQDVLGVPEGPVVTPAAAIAMAEGVRRVLGADIGVAVTGVAGPTKQEGQPIGTVFAGLALPGEDPVALDFHLTGDRQRIREFACINVLDALRRRLLAQPVG